MDDASDAKWLTFAELASARGISEPSARKLVRRHKWRRQGTKCRCNSWRRRQLREQLEQANSRAERGGEADRTRADALRDRLKRKLGLGLVFEAMQTQLAEAQGALQAAAEAERRASHAEAGRDGERGRADALADRVHVLQAALDQAQRDAQAAQDRTDAERRAEAAARQVRGLLARLGAALRGHDRCPGSAPPGTGMPHPITARPLNPS